MAKLVITDEMLDAIEAVKGVRDSRMWDPNCKRYMENQENSKKDVKIIDINNNLSNYIHNSISVLSNENSEKNFRINFDLMEDIAVILKDSKGDPKKNRLTIIVDLSI